MTRLLRQIGPRGPYRERGPSITRLLRQIGPRRTLQRERALHN